MRTLTNLSIMLLLVSAQPLWAKPPVEASDCESRLEALPQRFESVKAEMRALGLKNLLAPLDAKKIAVSFREKNFFWQSSVTWKFSWFSKDKLILRHLKWDSEKERQNSIWRVALALYNLQAPRRLWDVKALQPDNPVDIELSSDGALAALQYFLYQYPSDWRDAENSRQTALNAELKTLLDSLPLVKQPLPGISRVKFITFWEDHFRRIAIVGAVCMVPHLVNLPHCFNAFEVSAKNQYELVTDPQRQEDMSNRYRDILYAEVREDIAELKAKLPDPEAKEQLEDLYRQYPNLAKE